MLKMGGRRRGHKRNSWLPYEVSRRLQRDAVVGLGMVLVSALGLLVSGAANDEFSVKFVDGLPQMSDGAPCQLLQVFPYDNPTAPTRAMVDCGDQSGGGLVVVVQYLFIAVLAVGVLLLMSAALTLLLASRFTPETLAVPVSIVAIILGLLAAYWGLAGDSPALVFQGFRPGSIAGYLRPGGTITTREGAVSFGLSLSAASLVRLTRR
ncbi:hypothetical protein LBMAG12_08260 [Actinomycetes bacterium]|nr:hypothetical protein LBMAG12_08260 [Actinomycetes bacterium]